MVEAPRGRAGVVLVPELLELPALFLPDPERAQRAGRLAAWLRRERPDVPCDLGAGALDAAGAAQMLRAAGCERALLVTSPPDGDAEGELFVQRVLERALQDAGLRVDVIAGDEDPLARLAERLGPRGKKVSPAPAAPLLLFDAAESASPELAGFARGADGAWSRCGSGRAGPLPGRVRRLRLVAAGAHGAAPDEGELLALSGWTAAPRATVAAVRGAGAERARLVGRPHSRAEWRALRELVVAAFPALTPELDLVLGWREQDVRPLHELYAGRGLGEINARLVENLAP